MKNKNGIIVGIVVVVLVIISLVVIKLNYKPSNDPKTPNEGTKEEVLNEKQKEYNEIEAELAKIEESQNEKRDKIAKLQDELEALVKAHPDWDEIQLRDSSEYKRIKNEIQELTDSIEKEEASKQPYYDREIVLQDEMDEVERAQ